MYKFQTSLFRAYCHCIINSLNDSNNMNADNEIFDTGNIKLTEWLTLLAQAQPEANVSESHRMYY